MTQDEREISLAVPRLKKTRRTRRKPTRKYLTKTVCDAAKPHADTRRDNIIWDRPGRPTAPEHVRGFALVVKPSGSKFFVYQYRLHGEQQRMNLGRYGELTVQQARKKAQDEKEKVRHGINPKEEKRALRQPKNVKTVGDLCDAYLRDYLLLETNDEGEFRPTTEEPANKSWRDDVQRIRDYVRPAVLDLGENEPPIHFGDVELSKLSTKHVSAMYRWIRRKGRGYLANRCLSLVRSMVNRAYEWELLEADHPHPARKIGGRRYTEKMRKRPVKTEEWARLQSAIDAYEPTRSRRKPDDALAARTRALFRLIAYTGLRASEVRERRWSDVDFGKAELTLPETKAGDGRIVPISHAALDVLTDLKKNYRVVGSPFVFPSPESPRTAPLSRSWTFRQWKKIREVASCPDVRTHDLRHAVATWMDEQGYPVQDIQRALGHASIQTTLRYMHGGRKRARKALGEFAREISSEPKAE